MRPLNEENNNFASENRADAFGGARRSPAVGVMLQIAPANVGSEDRHAVGKRSAMPPRSRDNDDERIARIDMILEELRLNTEDLRELAERAWPRAAESRRSTCLALDDARQRHARIGRRRR